MSPQQQQHQHQRLTSCLSAPRAVWQMRPKLEKQRQHITISWVCELLCCSFFRDEVLACVKVPQTLPPIYKNMSGTVRT